MVTKDIKIFRVQIICFCKVKIESLVSIPNTSIHAYFCIYFNMFVRKIFLGLCNVKHFSVKTVTAVHPPISPFTSPLCQCSLTVRNQNKSLLRSNPGVNDRKTAYLDASTTHVCHEKNEKKSPKEDFQLLVLIFIFPLLALPVDNTDTLIHHDSSHHPSHLCLFSEDGKR